jgi:predicted TIM-barrel fold metal-dependent hydrolase
MTEQILHELGVRPNIMNEFEIAATLHEAQIGISQCREIVKCLKTNLGLEKFVWRKII